MAEIKAIEVKISGLIKDINGCKEMSEEKKRILRRNVGSMLKTIDLPDSFYDARERVGYLAVVIVTISLAVSLILTEWINSLWIIGAWILIFPIRALYLPSLDDITLGIIKSGNSILHRIFIKQNK